MQQLSYKQTQIQFPTRFFTSQISLVVVPNTLILPFLQLSYTYPATHTLEPSIKLPYKIQHADTICTQLPTYFTNMYSYIWVHTYITRSKYPRAIDATGGGANLHMHHAYIPQVQVYNNYDTCIYIFSMYIQALYTLDLYSLVITLATSQLCTTRIGKRTVNNIVVIRVYMMYIRTRMINRVPIYNRRLDYRHMHVCTLLSSFFAFFYTFLSSSRF